MFQSRSGSRPEWLCIPEAPAALAAESCRSTGALFEQVRKKAVSGKRKKKGRVDAHLSECFALKGEYLKNTTGVIFIRTKKSI